MRPNLFLIISLAALNIKEKSEDESASPKESCVEIFPCGSGVSINIKTWVFYQGWFPRFGFFISRPYAVFYTMKVVFFIKECTFYSFQLFLKLKQWFYHFYQFDKWLLDVILAFGPWVGLGLRWLSTLSDLSWVFYQIGWVFYQIAENWSILKGGNLPAKWVIETPGDFVKCSLLLHSASVRFTVF